MVITLVACACSLWLMMNNFHFPAEEVLRIALICFMLVLPMIVVAALIGFISRKISDRYLDDFPELSSAADEAADGNTDPDNINNKTGHNNAVHPDDDSHSEVNPAQQANPHSNSIDKNQEKKHS